MKRFFAILLAAFLLMGSCAMAAEETIDLFVTDAGTKVTLTMQAPYNIQFNDVDADHMNAFISREDVEDVIVIVSKTDSDFAFNLADMTEEDKTKQIEYLKNVEFEGYEFVEVNLAKTPAGNEYFDIVAKHDIIEVQRRFTVFDGYYFDRMQISMDGSLTEKDKAFMDEVQQGMWVE